MDKIKKINDNMIKASLIKDALSVVDELSKLESDEYDDVIEKLIKRAKNLKKNRLWKLN